ncbi:hypothetical protein SETIT_3G044900v2 [Setaria italica]|uniref:Uncharacterized protein n=1 Tax=Setaria italica TaxID=4555 RepID=A0A368QBL7_SETIT|nr:hypothetical protein SETIT_3G044900v2 [Setaria italica]
MHRFQWLHGGGHRRWRSVFPGLLLCRGSLGVSLASMYIKSNPQMNCRYEQQRKGCWGQQAATMSIPDADKQKNNTECRKNYISLNATFRHNNEHIYATPRC